MKNASTFIYNVILIVTYHYIVASKTTNQATQNPITLLYSTVNEIKITNFSSIGEKLSPKILVRNFTEGPAFDYIYDGQKLCWANIGASLKEQSILCDGFDGVETKNKVEIIATDIENPMGLACDWFTNKLYWTDFETKRIEVVSLASKSRKILFWTDIDQPRAITLVPMKGLMFWTDWGDVPKIERASMDGNPKTRKIIVRSDIFWPNGLAVDYETELIYWIDGKLLRIEVMSYEGTNRSVVTKSNMKFPFALDFYQHFLFWTDWTTWSLNVFEKNNHKFKQLNPIEKVSTMYIHVFDKKRQPKNSHPCENNNGGCSDLCLLSSVSPGYSCACRTGIKLLDNHTCAKEPQELLLLARRSDILLIYMDSPGYFYKKLPLDVKYTIAVDYDPLDQYMYWSDEEAKNIQKARLNGTNQQTVVTDDIVQIEGIALDWVSRNIYWTDAGTDRVEVCTLNGKYRRVVVFGDLMEPRAIAVAPNLGWLFWSDWYKKGPKVERANLDGSERKAIIVGNLGWPNGITLDLEKERLYWCDAKLDQIEYSNMDGTDRMVLINDNVPHVFGFSLMGNFLYWTDWQRRTINRAHKDTGDHREVILDQLPNVMGLKAINMQETRLENDCSVKNGNCEQICFYRHNKTKVCACELGYELAKDGFSCLKPDIFLLYTKKDQIGMISIENSNNEVIVPIAGINNCSSISYDAKKRRIYWSDTVSRTIMRASLNGSDPKIVVDLGLEFPEGVAIDWLGLNIYWTDPSSEKIEVARLPGTSRKALLWDGTINEPHSIVLDPPNGRMYWSEWGFSKAIKKGPMDGSYTEELVATKGYAHQLTLDYDSKRLYWLEINSNTISSVDLNGNDVRYLTRDIFKPVALTLYKDFIFWCDQQTGEIIKASKQNGANRIVIHSNCHNITDIQVYHSEQHGSNQCTTSNGGCTDLCLALPLDAKENIAKYICACPTHYSLVDNECIPPTEFMIYSQKNLTVRILPNRGVSLEVDLPIQGLKSVKAIDFDPINRSVYWIEGKTHVIKRSDLGRSETSSVIVQGTKEVQLYDLVIDPLGRLLFWTSSLNGINVTRLDNDSPFGVIIQKEHEQPRLLAIHITKRLLFYTDIGSVQKLVRTRLDGSHRLVIVGDSNISAIAVDQENDCIVWAKGQSLSMSNIEGENRVSLLNDTDTKSIQLTILSGGVYWIDRESRLQRVDLQSGKQTTDVFLRSSHVVDLISVSMPKMDHPCHQNKQHRCSHFCILNGTSPVCGCPNGNVLTKDKLTCSALQKCGHDRFTCASVLGPDPNCIPITWKCDKDRDCVDGSDELNCPECPKDHFKCKDGSCLASSKVCDGTPDCTDQSDEESCCPDLFQCVRTRVCISKSALCDKRDDCADNSDEDPILCGTVNSEKDKASTGGIVAAVIGVAVTVFIVVLGIFRYLRFSKNTEEYNDQSANFLNPMQPKPQIKFRKGIPDVVRMSMVTGSETSYDRNHITGASSSTIESSLTSYPREPLNPPPSPATTIRGSSPSSRYRPYRHYRSINQPPPPTPCSTDVCDESECNYPTRRYEGGPFPPPPTPRSHCHSESCPPSPSSRSSTYFNPLPPPPSPVASVPRGYDS